MIVRPVADGVEVLAPAKLNLFLEILGRRPDGYHEIESLMVAVDLYDTLTFADAPSGAITLRCDDPTLPTGPENLVVKAAKRLKAASGSPHGATIGLRKAIPAQAGLAGGSSDAAATLTALDRLWDLRTPPDRLDALAGEIGSDVAFFRHAPAAICRGRGERVDALTVRTTLHFVLICPPVGLSTADVYRNLTPPERPRPIGPVREALVDGGPAALGRSLFNRLQATAEALEPALVRVRNALADLGPSLDGHLMSGSGSAYFGLARHRAAAADAARRLEPLGLGRVRVVTCGPRAAMPRKGVPAVEITEVRIKLMEDNSGSNERLQAFCSITFDDMFVIRDLKIIEGAKGFFVAMPSRKLTDRCHNCGTKNHLRSRFCNQCGSRLDENRAIRDADGRAKLHADIAHPINSMCREKIQSAVLASYADELERSKLPGYVSRYDDFDAEYDLPVSYDAAAPGAPAGGEPPLRRGPLRGHTQHTRGNQSVLRGPHVPPRTKETPAEGIGFERGESSGFGNGL